MDPWSKCKTWNYKILRIKYRANIHDVVFGMISWILHQRYSNKITYSKLLFLKNKKKLNIKKHCQQRKKVKHTIWENIANYISDKWLICNIFITEYITYICNIHVIHMGDCLPHWEKIRNWGKKRVVICILCTNLLRRAQETAPRGFRQLRSLREVKDHGC